VLEAWVVSGCLGLRFFYVVGFVFGFFLVVFSLLFLGRCFRLGRGVLVAWSAVWIVRSVCGCFSAGSSVAVWLFLLCFLLCASDHVFLVVVFESCFFFFGAGVAGRRLLDGGHWRG